VASTTPTCSAVRLCKAEAPILKLFWEKGPPTFKTLTVLEHGLRLVWSIGFLDPAVCQCLYQGN
jgi:hypothetical protein